MKGYRKLTIYIDEVSGLWYRQHYLDKTHAELAVLVNGCGSAQAKFDFVPDNILGVDVAPACGPHDVGYAEPGRTWEDKIIEDLLFLVNMMILINRCMKSGRRFSFIRIWRRSRAAKYFGAVWWRGDDAFEGEDNIQGDPVS